MWVGCGEGGRGMEGGREKGRRVRKREAEGWVEWRTRSENGDNAFRILPFRSKLHIFSVFA